MASEKDSTGLELSRAGGGPVTNVVVVSGLAGAGAPGSAAAAAAAAGAAARAAASLAERHRPVPFWSFAAFSEGATLVLVGEEEERPWFNVLLVFVPLAIASAASGWGDSATFALSLVSMLPLAERLGFCTEELSEHVNDTVAGLMNASMGNAPELIIAIFALFDRLLQVTRISLIGSVLSNLLLVLGMSLLAGGLYHNHQHYKNMTSAMATAMLLVGSIAVAVPTTLVFSGSENKAGSALLASRISSLFLLALYFCYLYFQLKSHAKLFDDADEESDGGGGAPGGGEGEEDEFDENDPQARYSRAAIAAAAAATAAAAAATAAAATASAAAKSADDITKAAAAAAAAAAKAAAGPAADAGGGEGGDAGSASLKSPRGGGASARGPTPRDTGRSSVSEGSHGLPAAKLKSAHSMSSVKSARHPGSSGGSGELAEREKLHEKHEVHLSFASSVLWLAAIAGLVAYMSEILIGSIEGASKSWGLTEAFVSCILVPVAGNAAEHFSAIIFAMKNRLDLSLGIAIGSSIQIFLFVLPLLVVIGWIANIPLSLDAEPFELVTIVMTVLVSGFLIQNGKSFWMSGTVLTLCYGIVATGYGLHVSLHSE